MTLNNNITQKELETIERYINKSLTLEELTAFEEKMTTNPDFKNQVEDIKTTLLGIETQALKETLDRFHNTLPETKSTIKNTSKIKLLNLRKLVAAAAVIIALGGFWYFNNDPNQKLYNKYYFPDPGLPTTMSSTNNYTFYEAMVNYKRKEYQIAINKWESQLKDKPKNDTLNYFIASAYLAMGQENKAIPFFKTTTQSNESNFKNEAYLYLGLAHLKTENIELAKNYLNMSHSKKSKDILSELEK